MQSANALMSVQPKQEIKISALGDINCLSCYFVNVKDSATGLNGKYWISADRHSFDGEKYTMELDICFDSVMDEKNFDEKKEDKHVGKHSGKSASKGRGKKRVKAGDDDRGRFFKSGKVGAPEGGSVSKPSSNRPFVRGSNNAVAK